MTEHTRLISIEVVKPFPFFYDIIIIVPDRVR